MDWGEIDRRTAEVNTAFEGKGLTMGYLKDGKIQGGLCVFSIRLLMITRLAITKSKVSACNYKAHCITTGQLDMSQSLS